SSACAPEPAHTPPLAPSYILPSASPHTPQGPAQRRHRPTKTKMSEIHRSCHDYRPHGRSSDSRSPRLSHRCPSGPSPEHAVAPSARTAPWAPGSAFVSQHRRPPPQRSGRSVCSAVAVTALTTLSNSPVPSARHHAEQPAARARRPLRPPVRTSYRKPLHRPGVVSNPARPRDGTRFFPTAAGPAGPAPVPPIGVDRPASRG